MHEQALSVERGSDGCYTVQEYGNRTRGEIFGRRGIDKNIHRNLAESWPRIFSLSLSHRHQYRQLGQDDRSLPIQQCCR